VVLRNESDQCYMMWTLKSCGIRSTGVINTTKDRHWGLVVLECRYDIHYVRGRWNVLISEDQYSLTYTR
jgi:hypothetical protein